MNYGTLIDNQLHPAPRAFSKLRIVAALQTALGRTDACSNICFVGRLIRDFSRRILFVFVISCMCGCVNIYTRCPTTNEKIESVYQCSREAAALSVICSFPQMMSDAGHADAFMWENIFTIPFLGLPCAVDTVCEAVIDTVLLPADWTLARQRNKKNTADKERN